MMLSFLALQSTLQEAAKAGDLAQVEILIRAGADVNARDGEGWTALHAAAERGHAAIVTALLKAGAYVNPETWPHRETPLHWAATRGPPESVKALIEAGADVQALSNYGTPLERASNEQIARLLIDAGADVNQRNQRWTWTAMHEAARSGQVWKVRLLLAEGAKPNPPTPSSPLHWAANREIADLLLDAGAALDSRDEMGNTPLHLNAFWGPDDGAASRLIEAGADVNAANHEGNTPLHRAVLLKRKPVVAALIKAGADLNHRNAEGDTPLALALFDPEIRTLLKDAGAEGDDFSATARAWGRRALLEFDHFIWALRGNPFAILFALVLWVLAFIRLRRVTRVADPTRRIRVALGTAWAAVGFTAFQNLALLLLMFVVGSATAQLAGPGWGFWVDVWEPLLWLGPAAAVLIGVSIGVCRRRGAPRGFLTARLVGLMACGLSTFTLMASFPSA
jgi:ankyrin repeat protein